MQLMRKTTWAQPVVRYFLLLAFWAVWLSLPFLLFDEEDVRHRMLYVKILPASLTNILLFFITAEWLGPWMLQRQRIKGFLFSALGLAVLFLLMQGFFKNWLLWPDNKGVVFHLFRSSVHVFLAVTLGVGYALVRHTLREEKAKQEAQQERLKSELSFLRSQVSPHFIFNVLNSIVYLIRSQSNQAESVTLQLSALMRYMLYENEQAQIPLAKEVGYLNNYIELQRIRFGEDCDIRVQMEGTAEHGIEPMLMIPFVENAFKHGVGMIEAPVIDISLIITEKSLNFTVRNKIASTHSEPKDRDSGIGLQNVRRRLELLYPNSHKLDVQAKGEWFEARLSLLFP